MHAVVLPEPRDGEGGCVRATQVEDLLRHSGSYATLDREVFLQRIERGAEALFSECGSRPPCWAEAGRAGLVDEIVLVERVDEEVLGLRVYDVQDGSARQDLAPLLHRRVPDPALFERLFFAPGTLRVEGAPPGALLTLDARDPVPIGGAGTFADLPAGKHAIAVDAEGYAPFFAGRLVRPGEVAEIAVQMEARPEPRVRRPGWATWAALGLALGGGVGLAAGATAPGTATHP